MTMQLGSQLSPTLQAQCKEAFVHRFTGEHFPAWARQPMPNGNAYPVQHATDADWLANSRFAVTKAGKLALRRGCQSNPTWPNNPELRRA